MDMEFNWYDSLTDVYRNTELSFWPNIKVHFQKSIF